MKLKFRMNTVILLMTYYCIFAHFPGFTYYNPVKYACMVAIGIYIVSNIRILKRKEFLSIHVALCLFCLILIYTSWVNRGILKERDPFLAAIVYAGALMELYLVMEITAVKGNAKGMINVYYYVTAVITLLTDVLAVVTVSSANDGAIYLVGTKFHVVYLHFFLLALYMAKYNLKKPFQGNYKIPTVLLVVLTLIISIFTDCATGIVGIVLFAVLLVLYGRHSNVLFKPQVYLAVLLISFAMSFMFRFLLVWEPAQYVLENFLNREITLSSRTKIFLAVPLLLKGHYLWGYGYGTTYELGRRLGGFPNTQNALWEWIWQCGILGAGVLILLIMLVMRYAYKSHKVRATDNSRYILILLYLLSALASVEITINEAYLGYLAMMLPLTYINSSAAKKRGLLKAEGE